MKYIRLDADQIGEEIELALLNDDIEKAGSVHLLVQKGMMLLREMIISNPDFSILMSGCDDILATFSGEHLEVFLLEDLKNCFFRATTYTISIGIGDNLQEALLNLRKAKLSGRDKIVGI